MYYLYVNILVRAFYFYSPRNQTSCQYKLSEKTIVQRIIEAHSVLESKYNIGTRVLSQNKIFALVRVRVIKVLVPIFYSAIKHRYPCFIS